MWNAREGTIWSPQFRVQLGARLICDVLRAALLRRDFALNIQKTSSSAAPSSCLDQSKHISREPISRLLDLARIDWIAASRLKSVGQDEAQLQGTSREIDSHCRACPLTFSGQDLKQQSFSVEAEATDTVRAY